MTSEDTTTLLDIQLARVFLPSLVDLARRGQTMTYSELVDVAKAKHPEMKHVQSVIPVSLGRRLEVIRVYCERENLPDLASLVKSKATDECGSFYVDRFDPVANREAVYARDWSGDVPDIDGYFNHFEQRVSCPSKPRKKSEARQLMADHYKSNRARYPASITSQRELIIERLMDGVDVDVAFEEALQGVAHGDACEP